ncbi:2-hydroxyglutaryl-CoA dehydratase [Paraliomyxa miuraensis]|uniref:2-hydroxyglutaryl-CoA dehydratase n=1 Tax=Paraliomyxa miuraensis TaxID=376150 RepID=UPI0022533683|nr:2-hydroxyglutaryl-CoA dehydratase [Paraliomyxa miuraensis]MCX4246878.1 2-hydroxyglutaryl-CoA dehydratase [Paraliomyxa miuraensis]
MATHAENRTQLLKVIQQPEVQQLLDQARERFSEEEGVSFHSINMQFQRPVEHGFTADQRPFTTMLFGGFTFRHEYLIQAHFQRLGYNVEPLPTPNTDAFQKGKEYGNNGQCNPTYFTVGNLVQYLEYLRDEQGMSTQEIIDKYFFITAGACGPCRFGMYEAEYRLALRNSGFDGFRVMLFQQKGGLKQGDVKAGLEMNADFFMGLVTCINMGDLLNELANQIRPYEVVPGQTDRVLAEALQFMGDAIKQIPPAQVSGKLREILASQSEGALDKLDLVVKFLDLLTTEDYTAPLREVARRMNEIEVDRLQPKPVVKVTGEFWAQTTEGDGNFNMFRFLQGEGAEIITEPIATWITYLMWQEKIKAADRRALDEAEGELKWYDVRKRVQLESKYYKKRAMMAFADKVYRREYDRLRGALGGTTHAIVDMFEMEELAHKFYHTRSEGGEGHLEVAKNIYYTVKGIAHMVLSLKPFGCMPSTQSDGAQSAVINHFKDMIYLPIETSGEGEINAHSRVQMALGEAKAKAKVEFFGVVEGSGYALEDLRAFQRSHPELNRPLFHVPEYEGMTGTGARFARYLIERMKAEGVRPGSRTRPDSELAAE